MFCIQNYCFQGNLFMNTLEIVRFYIVVVCIPTPEFQYCDDVWNQAQTNQSKDRASTDVD